MNKGSATAATARAPMNQAEWARMNDACFESPERMSIAPLSDLLSHSFAQDACGTEDQQQNEDQEHKDVFPGC